MLERVEFAEEFYRNQQKIYRIQWRQNKFQRNRTIKLYTNGAGEIGFRSSK